MTKPNHTAYLEHKDRYAVMVFFTKEQLDILIAAAGSTNIAKFIRDVVLEEVGLEE
jgi:hypothetical protein